MKRPAIFLVVFGLFWSAITLGFDVLAARGILGQIRSLGFTATDGRIVTSAITTHRGKRTSYGARVRYAYRVDGRTYESERVRYNETKTSDGAWARRTVAENPAGAARTVHYDPDAPTEAVLQPGLNGQNLFLPLFLTPFNAIMIGLWSWALAARRSESPQGDARIRDVAGEFHVRFIGTPPWAAALAALGLAAFVGTFGIAFTAGFDPPLAVAVSVWGLVLAAAVVAFFWQRRVELARKVDLIVNPRRGTLTRLRAPRPIDSNTASLREWRRANHEALVVPFGAIRAVVVRQVFSSSRKANQHVVALATRAPGGGAEEEHILAAWHSPARAEAFAAWLRSVLPHSR